MQILGITVVLLAGGSALRAQPLRCHPPLLVASVAAGGPTLRARGQLLRCRPPVLVAPSSDPFRVVGVSPGASLEEVKQAFRARSRELHPDAGGSAEEFQELVRAYKLLQDPVARAELAITSADSLDFMSPDGKVYRATESCRRQTNVVQAGARERAERAAARADAAEAGRAGMAQRRARMAQRTAAGKAADAEGASGAGSDSLS